MNYLTKLKELASKATNCKWEAKIWCGAEDNVWASVGPVHKQEDDDLDPSSIAAQIAERDAAFIAESRTAVPKLVEALEVAQKALELEVCFHDSIPRKEEIAAYTVARDALTRIDGILDGVGGEK